MQLTIEVPQNILEIAEKEGYEVVGYRSPKEGEYYMNNNLINGKLLVMRAITGRQGICISFIVEKTRWRAEAGEIFWYVDVDGTFVDSCDIRDTVDDAMWDIGNYYQTEEQAEQALEAVKKAYMSVHG